MTDSEGEEGAKVVVGRQDASKASAMYVLATTMYKRASGLVGRGQRKLNQGMSELALRRRFGGFETRQENKSHGDRPGPGTCRSCLAGSWFLGPLPGEAATWAADKFPHGHGRLRRSALLKGRIRSTGPIVPAMSSTLVRRGSPRDDPGNMTAEWCISSCVGADSSTLAPAGDGDMV
jgi:hypothetical protein